MHSADLGLRQGSAESQRQRLKCAHTADVGVRNDVACQHASDKP